MNLQSTKIIYSPDSADIVPIRLDKFLSESFSSHSRTYFREMADRGLIAVNGKKASKASLLLRGNEEIELTFFRKEPLAIKPIAVDFKVVVEEEDFFVIDKPAGIIVHPPSHESTEPTLVHGLLYKFKEMQHIDDAVRPGIVHRLDKDTSGLMLVARTELAVTDLCALFKDRLITKKYLAVVQGHPVKEGVISFPIGRSLHVPKKMTHTRIDGKAAETRYKVLQYYATCALVEAQPTTGRTHQIRVHFAAIGHSLVGDALYGKSSTYIKRHALHAWQLSFLYHGQKKEFHTHVPQDFRKLLILLQQEKIKTK